MIIREMSSEDWEAFFPTFTDVVEAGESYAFPTGMGAAEALRWWLSAPPGVTVVAVDEESGTVLGSAKTGPNRPGRGSHVSTALVHGGRRGADAG